MKIDKHSWPNFPWKNLYDNAIKRKSANNNDVQTDIELIQEEEALLVGIKQDADYINETKSSQEEQILPLPTGRGVRIFD